MASVTPPTGETIASWTVTARNLDRGMPIVLATGSGAPPTPLATFDPTLLINGAYQILDHGRVVGRRHGHLARQRVRQRRHEARGLHHDLSRHGDVDRRLPGTSAADIRHQGQPCRRLRSRLAPRTLGLPRATPNNRLGQGGWSTEPFGFPFTQFRFNTSVPHFVTVTSPGGRSRCSTSCRLRPGHCSRSRRRRSSRVRARAPRRRSKTSRRRRCRSPAIHSPTSSAARSTIRTCSGSRPRTAIVLIIDRFDGLRSITDRNGNELIVHSRATSSRRRLPGLGLHARRCRPDHRDRRTGRAADAVYVLRHWGPAVLYRRERQRRHVHLRCRSSPAQRSTVRARADCGP